MGSNDEKNFVQRVRDVLAQDYRGVNIAVYVIASAGLGIAIHRIRPVSKFSRAGQIPSHFLERQEPLIGKYTGVSHSPVKLLIDHKPPIKLPLWHSAKSPLPVKLWGVEIASGNAVNWLECVAKGRQVTMRPVSRDGDTLLSTVTLHLPKPNSKVEETVDIGQKLVELGYAKTAVPNKLNRNGIEYKVAPALMSAEKKAKTYRNGIWSEILPPIPLYIILWRKFATKSLEISIISGKAMAHLMYLMMKGTFMGVKAIAMRPFRKGKVQPL